MISKKQQKAQNIRVKNKKMWRGSANPNGKSRFKKKNVNRRKRKGGTDKQLFDK